MLRYISILVLILQSLSFAQDKHPVVSVEFKVTVPKNTPAKSKIFLSGNTAQLGEWNGAGVQLAKKDAQTYSVTIPLPQNEPIEFKVTRGSWETVEKTAEGTEMENRTMTADANKTVQVTVAMWADQQKGAAPAPKPARPSTRTGDIRTPAFHSNILRSDRKLWIYLPPDYDKDLSARYPVFYMHDGQNLFDNATSFAGEWHADETAQKLIGEKKIKPVIIVGIANTNERMDEYTPDVDQHREAGGKGDLYAKMVAEEVKPFVDKNFRTLADREHTAIGGSSLGGLISLHIAQKYPQVFGMCAAMSPTLGWNGRSALKRLESDPGFFRETKFWLDTGTAEGDSNIAASQVEDVRALAAMLQKAGRKLDVDYHVEVEEAAVHNEAAWGKRFEAVLLFYFK